jgi:hypothetical protein
MLFLPETWSQICCSIKYKKFHFHSEEYYNCCPGHIVDDSLGDDSLTHLSDLKSECSFNRTDIINLPEQIRAAIIIFFTMKMEFLIFDGTTNL